MLLKHWGPFQHAQCTHSDLSCFRKEWTVYSLNTPNTIRFWTSTHIPLGIVSSPLDLCAKSKSCPFFKSHLKCYLVLETLSSSSNQTSFLLIHHSILPYVIVILCFYICYSSQGSLSHTVARYSIYSSYAALKTNRKLISYKSLRCSQCQAKKLLLNKQGTLSLPSQNDTWIGIRCLHKKSQPSVTAVWPRA